MKVFRELRISGNKEELDAFIHDISQYATNNWVYTTSERLEKYILFDYVGSDLEKAELSIYYGTEYAESEIISVGNIVPLEKSQISVEEYNNLLLSFYNEVIMPYKKNNPETHIEEPTSNEFNPLDYISESALNKLKRFCNSANKSTGSSHPLDEERWFDFICQTVDDDRIIGADILREFLMDEEYWGKKDDGFLGVIGKFAWDESEASELSYEYERYVSLIKYYKRTRLNECV